MPGRADQPVTVTSRLVAVAAAAAVSGGLVLTWAAVGSDGGAPNAAKVDSAENLRLLIDEGILAPVSFNRRPGGQMPAAVVTLFVHNDSGAPVTVTKVTPLVDDGLEVDYLGYTRCLHECVGSLPWNRETRGSVDRSQEGDVPVRLFPPSTRTLPKGFILRLAPSERLAGTTGVGCLRLHALELALEDGRSAVATMPSGAPIAGIRRIAPRPSARCDL